MTSRDELMKQLSLMLYNRRMDMGLTQMQMAEALDVDFSCYKAWELRRAIPRAVMLIKLADFFGCSVDELLGRADA